MLCPKCKQRLDRLSYEGVGLLDCGGCGGKLVDRLALKKILSGGPPLVEQAVRDKLTEIAAAADSRKPVWCYTCGEVMVRTTLTMLPQVQIDQCGTCHLIWLDQGELERVRFLWDDVRAEMQKTQPGDVLERLALLDAQLAASEADQEARKEAAERRKWRPIDYGRPGGL